jgi:predicted deacylase
MKIGTAETSPGEHTTGYVHITDLPTGQAEQVPVVIVDGPESGPTVWVTASIHGDETNGLAAAQDFVDDIQGDLIRGLVVCIPTMNPAGLRQNTRTSYYHDDDPNRYFARDDDESETPRVQQLIDEQLFEYIADTADAVVSLHTSWIATFPYVIQPRVTYGKHRDEATAIDLSDRISDLTEAFGLPVVNQFGHAETRRRSLQHTLTGAATIKEGIPAFTPELGGRFVVNEDIRQAAVDGLHNVLQSLEMVSNPRTTDSSFSLPTNENLKRLVHPHADTAGIVRYRVQEGDRIEAGQVVADIVTPHGEQRNTVESYHHGYVLSRYEGAAVYENDPILDLAVPDDEPLVTEHVE